MRCGRARNTDRTKPKHNTCDRIPPESIRRARSVHGISSLSCVHSSYHDAPDMHTLNGQDIAIILLGLGILLASARVLGELATRFNQPAIIGEILSGIILGPTVLGRLMPETLGMLFPTEGSPAVVLQGFTTVAVVLFLLGIIENL